MDPLTRKLFQPREAREKLRGMGGIMSSSPQLASTVAKFQQGGPIQSRGLAMPSAPDAPLPSAGRARATNVGGRAFVLTDDGRVLDAQTGAPATPEVEAEVRSRLSPQLNMMDIVGEPLDPNLLNLGVNPSFREDTSGQLPPTPSDIPSETVLANPGVDPEVTDAFGQDMIGVGRTILSPIVTSIDELPYDDPFISPVQPPRTPREDTHSANLRAAIESAQSGETGFNLEAFGGGVVDDIGYTADAILSPFTGSSQIADEEMLDASRRSAEEAAALRDAQGITESLGSPVEPAVEEPSVETTDPTTDQGGPEDDDQEAPPENLDPNDPDTFDTTYDKMLTRLQSVMGTKDEDSRQKAMANLAMIGLAIAAGQSPDALTNIAQGALTGVKAIREDQAADREQDKALRMAALNAALEMEQGTRSAEATAARDELKFQRDLQLEQEKARFNVGGSRDPRAIEDFTQDTYKAAFSAASSASPPEDMSEGETPSAYAQRITRGSLQFQQIMFPQTYGVNPEVLSVVQESLKGGIPPEKVREDFLTTYPGADPSYYGL